MSNVIALKIAGLGRALPHRTVYNDELEDLLSLPSGWIELNNGVCERRWVTEAETSSWLGAEAAREAVAQAGLALHEIDLIINASGTPEQTLPDTAPLIQRQLGLGNTGVTAFSVHSTCLSFLSGLEVAAAFLQAGRYHNILIVSSEVASAGLNPYDPETFTLFGDAAAAAVITRPAPDEACSLEALRLETYGSGADLTAIFGGGSRRPPGHPSTTFADNHFFMDGSGVLRLVHRYGAPFLEHLRPGLSTGMTGLDYIVPHQPSRTALRLLRRYDWPEDRILRTLEKYGNCIAASLPLTLYEGVSSGVIKRGHRLLLVGTGAGLSLGGAVLTY